MARYNRLDWTGRDYTSARADLLALIQQNFPDFTRTNPSDPEMAVFELTAYIADLIGYYQDRQANEAFLITAQERANVIRHLAGIGYRMATAAAATASLTFTLPQSLSVAVTIEQGQQITTEVGDVSGELADLLEIPAGQMSGTVDWIQGETISEDLGESDGTAAQGFQLAQTPFLWGSETVVVDGIIWSRVDNFLSSDSAAQVYTVEVDAFDQATITFGDGTNGALPANGAILSASYRTGGGVIGNVEAGTLTKVVGTILAADGTPVTGITANNPLVASGGSDRESTAHGKLYGPKQLSTNGRAITADDYATIAEQVPGVIRALAQTSDDDTRIAENSVHVQVVPVGGGTPTQTLLDAVEMALLAVKPNTTRIRVLPALYLNLTITGTVYLRHAASGQAIQLSAIEAEADAILQTAAQASASVSSPGALDTYFDAGNIDVANGEFTVVFGSSSSIVPLSDIISTIVTSGTLRKYVDLTAPVADIAVAASLFPCLQPYTKAVLPADTNSPDRVEFTWTLTGTKLVVREEP